MNQLLGIGLALTTMCLSAFGTCLFKPLTNNFEKVSEICDQAFYRYIFPLFTSLMCKHGSMVRQVCRTSWCHRHTFMLGH